MTHATRILTVLLFAAFAALLMDQPLARADDRQCVPKSWYQLCRDSNGQWEECPYLPGSGCHPVAPPVGPVPGINS